MNHPWVLVVYNRPQHTAQVLQALARHRPEPLYVFCDGPVSYPGVAAVRDTVRSHVTWTKPLMIEREDHYGLSRSIVAAADYVLERYESIILLEDDCVPGPHFSHFMQTCLDRYEDVDAILGVTGYTVPVSASLLKSHSWDVYFFPRIGSWGWGTWRNRWEFYQRDVAAAYDRAKQQGCDLTAGGADIPGMIERSITGQLDAWTPGWVLANALTETYYVYPTVSHVTNIGHDGTGVHCGKTGRYKSPIAQTKPTRFPSGVLVPNRRLVVNFRKYYQ